MADMKNGLFPPAAAAAADDIPSKLISEWDSRSVEGRCPRKEPSASRSVVPVATLSSCPRDQNSDDQ